MIRFPVGAATSASIVDAMKRVPAIRQRAASFAKGRCVVRRGLQGAHFLLVGICPKFIF
jgi:hypothetical protein